MDEHRERSKAEMENNNSQPYQPTNHPTNQPQFDGPGGSHSLSTYLNGFDLLVGFSLLFCHKSRLLTF